MQGSYAEVYLDDAMRNMGEMTEYAAEVCHISLDLLFHMFIVSGYARRWEQGDPLFCAGCPGRSSAGGFWRNVEWMAGADNRR